MKGGTAVKKLLACTIIFLGIITAHSINAFAASTSVTVPVDRFEITCGMDLSKDAVSTFDSTRIISGTAEKGAEIVITVYDTTSNQGFEYPRLTNQYKLTVGSTGIFSQTIALNEGKNYIVVEATKDGKYSRASTIINRKGMVIKTVLSQYIALPGQKNSW